MAACVALLGCGAEVDERPASWSYIHAAIIVPNCATSACHSTLSKTKGVDLEDHASAYRAFHDSGNNLNDIGRLLRGQVNGYYRMPPDQPLPEADIELVERWLAGPRLDD